MNKIKNLIIVLAAGLMLTSCSAKFTYPSMVTENPVGEKVGKSSYDVIGIPLLANFPWICFNRDRGVAKAAKNGDIDKIATVDFQIEQNFFSVTYRTIVTGK